MFTLRRISGNGIEMNKEIGDGYTLVDKDANEDEFNKTLSIHFRGDTPETHEIYCFLSADDGKYLQPLYKNQQNFIMSESGRTFANLTHVDLKHELKWGKKK